MTDYKVTVVISDRPNKTPVIEASIDPPPQPGVITSQAVMLWLTIREYLTKGPTHDSRSKTNKSRRAQKTTTKPKPPSRGKARKVGKTKTPR